MQDNSQKYISIDVIASRIKKHPMLKDMNYEDIISHTVDVLRLINMPPTYVEELECKKIIDYKVRIPENSKSIVAVDLVKGENRIPMVEATDTAQKHLHKLPESRNNKTLYTYTQSNNTLHFNIKEGEVDIIYNTLKCSPEGIPMIPDNVSVIKAIENYIKVEMFSMYVDLGKMGPGSLQRVEQEYAWYIGKAQTQFQGLNNEDSVETFLADLQRMFIKNTTHKDRHRYNANRELRFKN